ncbi:hypothetical protein CERZMDRAFT_96146 [Cercospora zeae-maydis SCOH1-5]|uniref:Uncharacterized protein n=1 Tax=Cercospora zeae-maydis SCOH1-5 TaxID=717836 RepID=A0A6A6FKX0_9PEZI|nr:hypothetical protein CERZMDRAFT_96146 [Cercospora zeae-maydis SCOH1-5]
MSFVTEDRKPVIDSGTGDMDWQWDTDDDEKDSRLTEDTARYPQTQLIPLLKVDSQTSSMPRTNSLRTHTGFKRRLGSGGLNLSHDVMQRRDHEAFPIPQRSAQPSLVEITDSKPHFRSRGAGHPLRLRTTTGAPFVQIDSESEDDKEPLDAKAPNCSPVSKPQGPPLILEQDREATLAASAARREEARKRKAEGGLNNGAASSKKAKHRFAPSTTSKSRGESFRLRPTETLAPRLQTLLAKNDGQSSKAQEQDVIVIRSDSGSPPRPGQLKNRNPTTSLARDQTLKEQSRFLPSSSRAPNHTSFTERVQKLKRERSSVTPLAPQTTIRPSIEIPDVAASIERSEVRRKRLDAEDAKNFAERFASECERGKEGTKAIAEHQRRQYEADTALKRGRDEKFRAELEQQAKVRQAALEDKRRQELERQRKEKADEKQNKDIAFGMQQLQKERKETQNKKLEADAARQRRRAEEEQQRNAERLRSTEEKRAELAKRPPVLDEQARKRRDERTRLKKERSARNKQAEDDNADEELIVPEAQKPQPQSLSALPRESQSNIGNEDHGTAAHPSDPASAFKPVALNSAAGVKAVNTASKASPCPGASSARAGHGRALGEILDEDAKLVHWKDTGDQWPAIAEKYEKLTGKKRAIGTLRRRYQQVSAALKEAGVCSMLKLRMFKGEEDFRRQVNSMVHGQWPLPADDGPRKDAAATETKKNLTERKISKDSLPAPGEILPIDALLIRWRNDGMIWSDVMRKYETIAGTRKREDTLRARWREVSDALEDATVFDDEIEALAYDAPGARARVNSKVWKVWPPVLKPPQTPRTQVLGARSRGTPPKVPRHDFGLGPRRLEPIAGPVATVQPLPQLLEDLDTEDASGQPHPTTAGKNINNEMFSKWLQARQDSLAANDGSSSTSGSDCESLVDEDDPEDLFYFVWRVYRRECTAEDEQEGIDVGKKEWRECGETYDCLDEANRAAEDETKLVVPGGVDFSDVEVDSKKEIHDDCHCFTLSSAEVGTLQVKVEISTCWPDHRIPPTSKKGWIAADIYCVMERTTTTSRTVDEVLNETVTERDIWKGVIDGTLTSHIDQANSRAAGIFAEKVLSKTVDLNFNSIQKMRKVEELLQNMEWDEKLEGPKFYGKHEFSDKGRVLEVWTHVTRLAGPRNHFQFRKARKEDRQYE